MAKSRNGGKHSLSWPVRLDELGALLERLRDGDAATYSSTSAVPEYVGDSRASQNIRKIVSQVAPSVASVLITGESGTGKEVVASQIHSQSGRDGDFVAVNCGAIPDELLESELFGHEKGAFTGAAAMRRGKFEQADKGTLFLDEIGDMPAAMQVKLLRVLQERVVERVGGIKSIPVDVRLIAATHRDLEASIKEETFREDLYYRLNVVEVELPALRDRRDDIVPLAYEMVSRIERRHATRIEFSSEALAALEAYDWPGNVRELANLVERLMVIKPHGEVGMADLPFEISGIEAPQPAPVVAPELASDAGLVSLQLPEDGVDLKAHIADVERHYIADALEQTNGVVAKAAKLLGMQRTTLVEKIKRYKLQG